MSANLKNFMKETSIMDSSKGAITTQTNPVAQDDASLGVSLDVSNPNNPNIIGQV